MRSRPLGWLSKYYEYTVAKQNESGAGWVELFITLTRRMGEPTYGVDFLASFVASYTKACFAGYSGLYCGDSFAVSILFCVRIAVSGL